MKDIRSTAYLAFEVRSHTNIQEVLGAIYGLDGLSLLEADLGPEFFDLKSGLLGEVFQKLVNYRLPTALVIADAAAYGERFTELAREHAIHPHIRLFSSEAAARSWLQSLP